MAGGGSNTSTSYQIPTNPTIENFITQTVPKIQATQDIAPLSQFAQPTLAKPMSSPSRSWASGQARSARRSACPGP